VAAPEAVVAGDRYRFTVLTDGLIRLEYAEDGRFEDRASTFALNRELPVPHFEVVERGTHLELLTDRLHLVYDGAPFSTTGLSVQVRGNISSYHSVWRFGDRPIGLGGTARTLDMADGRVPLEPGVASREGFAVIDDSASPLFTDDGWVAPRDGSKIDLYLFCYGHDYAGAVAALYAVAGPTPVLPRFALGNWWSRYYEYTDASYLKLLDRFAAAGLPFSVAVLDMDWHLVDIDPRYGSGWTGYTWNRALFPDPTAFLAEVHRRGLHVTLNVHPADGVRAFEDAYPEMAAALGLDPDAGLPIAFDVTDQVFMAAYLGILHRGLERQGVDFWWLDWQSGPHSRVAGIDPLWMLNHFHFLDNARPTDEEPSRRPLTFSRYAGPGSHRYPIGFSGDALITWDSLRFQPEFTATASNIGYGWWSHDVGGHMMGVRDDELAARWLQLGAFSPIMRLHSGKNPFITKEPWSWAPETEAVFTRFLRLRHRLIPYLHSMNHRAAAQGRPLVEPMYWDHPENPEAYAVPNQFRFGTQMLVVPITDPADPVTRMGSVAAWLPPGVWTDLFTGRRYAGDREIVLHRPLAEMPVLAAAGAIIPLDAAAVPTDDPTNPEALEILIVAGTDGAFELVEDDGAGDGLDEDHIARTALRYDDAARVLRIDPPRGTWLPPTRSWTVTVLEAGTRASVTVSAAATDQPLEIPLPSPEAVPNGTADVFAILDRAYLEHDGKVAALRAATADQPAAVRLSRVLALGLPPALTSALAEVLAGGTESPAAASVRS